MGANSGIEWTEATWNPIAGCSVISPGCTNCYAMKMAARLEAMWVPLYAGLTTQSKAGAVWNGKIRVAPSRQFDAPRRWRKPRMVFVNSMSDLFHEDIPFQAVSAVFDVMGCENRHTYQILTKRSYVMRERVSQILGSVAPLPNVWLGVSVENRETLSRLDDLRATPAAVRFVSFEPLLEDLGDVDLTGIHWAIIGAESGKDARPMMADWAESIIAQCRRDGVAVFVKQLSGMGGRAVKDMAQFRESLRVREFPA